MLDPAVAARLRATLTSIGGGYLRNPVRLRGITCTDCTTPVEGYRLCYPCKGHHIHAGLADATAFLTYAVAGEKSGYVMRGYKAKSAIGEHRMVVGLLVIWLFMSTQDASVGSLAGWSPTGQLCRRCRPSQVNIPCEALPLVTWWVARSCL